MPARVIVIGLDAADAFLIEAMVAEGALPAIASLTARGAVYRLGNSLETLPGAIWPELTSGRSCGQVPLYYHPRQLHTGEACLRPVEAGEVDSGDYYWSIANTGGRRIAVIDQPQTIMTPGLNGIQLLEWGLHDRNFEIASDPPELLDEVIQRYGAHPITSCDLHGRRTDEYERLLDRLLEGVSRKTDLLLDLLDRENWDLFTGTYGESHCVGHQFWHFHDVDFPGFDFGAPPHLKDAIRTVYRRIDQGIEKLVEAAGSDASVIVVSSHGMGPYNGGCQLLPEVLIRLGMGSDQRQLPETGRANQLNFRNLLGPMIRKAQIKASHLPRPVQPLLKSLAGSAPFTWFERGVGCLLNPLESSRTRAVALRNNRCGAVRLNLAGREPFGSVQPGDDARELTEEIRRELEALLNPATGQPIVDKTITAEEAFGPNHHPDVPDLMVVFRTDQGRLEACESESVGRVEAPIFHPNLPRSGDHTVDSRLWISGPGIPSVKPTLEGNVLDLAPTVLRLLDVPLPETLDGDPLSVVEEMSKITLPA